MRALESAVSAVEHCRAGVAQAERFDAIGAVALAREVQPALDGVGSRLRRGGEEGVGDVLPKEVGSLGRAGHALVELASEGELLSADEAFDHAVAVPTGGPIAVHALSRLAKEPTGVTGRREVEAEHAMRASQCDEAVEGSLRRSSSRRVGEGGERDG